MAERAWRDIWRMESARAFAPLREGGAARRKMVYGSRVRSGRKGRRGEYCGWPSIHAPAWSIRKRLDLFVAGGKARAATADRSTPPVAAPAACLLPYIRLPFMAAPPPSRRGAGSVALLAPCIRGIRETVPLEQIKKKCSRKPGRARLRPGLVFRPCTRPRQSAALPKRLQNFLNRSRTVSKIVWLRAVVSPAISHRGRAEARPSPWRAHRVALPRDLVVGKRLGRHRIA